MTHQHEDPLRCNSGDPDALLAADIAEVNALLDELIDVDAGWDELMDEPDLHRAVQEYRWRVADRADISPAELDEGESRLQAICRQLDEVVFQLNRIEDFNSLTTEHCPSVAGHIELVTRHVKVMRHGLASRVLTKKQAVSNLWEASSALTTAQKVLHQAEDATAEKLSRRRLRVVSGFADQAAQLLATVAPQVINLFDDTDEFQPCTPTPTT